MVGADFERGGQRRQCGTVPEVAAQGHPCAAHHQRGVDQRPHLGDVARADDQQEVGRESVGQYGDDADPGVDAEDEQHAPHGGHREEEECGRGVDQFDHLPDGTLDRLCRVGHVDQVGGHAAEHAAGPLGVFIPFGAHLGDVPGHSLVLQHVVLGQHLAPELGGEIGGAHDEEEDKRHDCREYFRCGTFRKIHSVES